MHIPSSLPELAQELRRLLRPDLPSRPFVADGSPFSCDVAIVGINPGTTTSFWDFWADDTGFARAQWVAEYYSRPEARRNATRNRIERLVPALKPLRVVELNAYPYATRTEADITPEMKEDLSVLHLMLRVTNPRALFLFGKAPAKTIAPLLGLPMPDLGTVTRCEYQGRPLVVFAEQHLSRGWSYQAVEAMATRVKGVLQSAPA